MKRRKFLSVVAGGALAAASPVTGNSAGKVALVLGGGGCRGFGHIGVIRVLQANGLRPDLVVGSSVGSLVGVLYASGLRAEDLERYGQALNPNLLRNWIFPKLGIFGGNGIRRFVNDRVKSRAIESLPIPFAAVATDLRTGEMVILDKGDPGLAVQASSSAPGLLEPVRVGKRMLVDGNLCAPVPVDAARRLGARTVVTVDVTFPPDQANLEDPFDALYQGFSILTRKLALEARSQAEVLIEPKIPEHHDMSRATIKSLVDAGERAALDALPRLRKVFSR